MRDEFAVQLPHVEVFDGAAKNLPLANASANAITVAQAFHWFDADTALEEFARVLVPGGGIGDCSGTNATKVWSGLTR